MMVPEMAIPPRYRKMNSMPDDPQYSRGCLMNCSEKKEFDGQFPQHPLSEARRFAEELAGLN